MSSKVVKELLVMFYLDIKMRNHDNLIVMTSNRLETEKQKLMKISIFDIIKYIYDYIDILIDRKAEEKYQERKKFEKEMKNDNSVIEYEKLLIKAEKEIRQHVQSELELRVRLEELEFLLNENQLSQNLKNNIYYNYQNFSLLKKNSNKKKNKKVYINLTSNKEISRKIKINNSNNYSKEDNAIVKQKKFNSLLGKKNNLSQQNNFLFDSCNFNVNSRIPRENLHFKLNPLVNPNINKKLFRKIITENNFIYNTADKLPTINLFQSNIKKENNTKQKYCNLLQKSSNFSKNTSKSKINLSKLYCKLKPKKHIPNLELKNRRKQNNSRHIKQNKFNNFNFTHISTNSNISNKIRNNSKTYNDSKKQVCKTVKKKRNLIDHTKIKLKTNSHEQFFVKIYRSSLASECLNHSLKTNKRFLYNTIITEDKSSNFINLNDINKKKKKKKFNKKLLLQYFSRKNSNSANKNKNESYIGFSTKRIDNRKIIKKY